MSGWKEGKQLMKGVPGVRKVWGTQKKESCNDVTKGDDQSSGKGGIPVLHSEATGQVKCEEQVVVHCENPRETSARLGQEMEA